MVTPVQKREAQTQALHAADLLDAGKQAQAKEALDQAQALDPDNALARTLKQSIVSNPVTELGDVSWAYVVKPNDTLSKISGQYLKDEYKFYLLARYNDIAVPKSLAAGRSIKIPGTKPKEPPKPAIATASQPAARVSPLDQRCEEGWRLLNAGEKDKAYDILVLCQDARSRTEADSLRAELVQLHERRAKEAYRRQDLDTSIHEWDRVLKLDPGYDVAKLGRERAVDLKAHLEGVN